MPRQQRPWFRYYVEILHDRKLRTRPPAQRVLWDALMCMAATSPERGVLLVAEGVPADEVVIADEAALSVKDTREGLEYFAGVGMVHRNDIGAWVVRSFLERQFESDSSTERTAKSRHNNGATNDEETSQERLQSVSVSGVVSKQETATEEFELFLVAYPRRDDKVKARKSFAQARKRASFDVILAGAERYRDDPNRDQAFTKMATTWLNGDCWENEPLPPRSGRDPNANQHRIERIVGETLGLTALDGGKS